MIPWMIDDLKAAGLTVELYPAKGLRTVIHVYDRDHVKIYANVCGTENSAIRKAYNKLIGDARHDVKLTETFVAKANAVQRQAHQVLVEWGVLE